MPCPFFEPQQPAAAVTNPYARLPLIDEYDGLCHANGKPQAAPAEVRFRCCNHGYSRTECARFPQSEQRSALRYSVIGEDGDALDVLCIEERDHIPVAGPSLRFDLATSSLSPSGLSAPAQAQALAFCRSYAIRFLRTS